MKPECPLCKQNFKSIYYNVRSIDDYDEYVLPAPRTYEWSFRDDGDLFSVSRSRSALTQFLFSLKLVIHLKVWLSRSSLLRRTCCKSSIRVVFLISGAAYQNNCALCNKSIKLSLYYMKFILRPALQNNCAFFIKGSNYHSLYII